MFQFEVASQQRRLSAGVDYEPALCLTGNSLRVGELDADGFITVEYHFSYLMAFEHVYTLELGVFKEYLIELGTPDLVGMGVPVAGLFEVPTPGSVATAPNHGCPVLL